MPAHIYSANSTYDTPEAAAAAIRANYTPEELRGVSFELHAFAIKPHAAARFNDCALEYCIVEGDDDGAAQGGVDLLESCERGALFLEDHHYVGIIEERGRYYWHDFDDE